MEAPKGVSLRLRPHHICCLPFFTRDFSEERGEDYLRIRNRIKYVLNSEPNSVVMVMEGVDEQCQECPLRQGDRCESPNGNEEKVRKWDAILMGELGVSYGEAFKVSEWRSLIAGKTPFKICRKCAWRESCTIGSRGGSEGGSGGGSASPGGAQVV